MNSQKHWGPPVFEEVCAPQWTHMAVTGSLLLLCLSVLHGTLSLPNSRATSLHVAINHMAGRMVDDGSLAPSVLSD